MENSNGQENKYFAKKERKEMYETKMAKRRKLKTLLKYLIALVVLAGMSWFFYSRIGREEDVSQIGHFFQEQNREHIAVGSEHPDYNSNPPTGGWHYGAAAQSGIYDRELPDEQIIHNLEHGHIWISYQPDLDAETVEKLAKIAEDFGSKIIVTVRSANETPIALSAWEYLLKLDSFNENKIRQFIESYRGKGPENIPDSGFKDFRNQY